MATATETGLYERFVLAASYYLPKKLKQLDGLYAKAEKGDLAASVSLADKLSVDARWLVTGQRSSASYAATAMALRWPAQFNLGKTFQSHLDDLIKLLELTPEPGPYCGTCRYCGCTDEHGCGDCSWVDGAATICSACLLPEA